MIDNDGTTHLADYSYLGLGTIVEVDETQPDLKFTLIGTAGGNDPDTGDIYRGVDRFGRVKDLLWRDYGASQDAARIQHGYDRAGNRLYRADPVAVANSAGFEELYGYDGSYRVKGLNRGTLNAGKTAVTSQTFAQCWTLDTTGNWKGFRQDDNGDGTWDLIQSRTASPVNEITNITNSTGSAWATPSYNAAGNMTSVPKPASPSSSYTATYDAWNRLVKLQDGANTVQENQYDGLRRRIVKKSYSGGTLTETRHMYYSAAWQILEERTGTSTTADRQFVWGLRYLDDLILRDRDPNADGTLDERLYALQDPNWNVIALTDVNGDVQERYAYAAYGFPIVLTSIFASRSSSSYAWETTYAGYRCDLETMLFPVRNRVYITGLGTWLQRDPAQSREAIHLYSYAASRPLQRVDPLGLQSCPGGMPDSPFGPTDDDQWLQELRKSYEEARERLRELLDSDPGAPRGSLPLGDVGSITYNRFDINKFTSSFRDRWKQLLEKYRSNPNDDFLNPGAPGNEAGTSDIWKVLSEAPEIFGESLQDTFDPEVEMNDWGKIPLGQKGLLAAGGGAALTQMDALQDFASKYIRKWKYNLPKQKIPIFGNQCIELRPYVGSRPDGWYMGTEANYQFEFGPRGTGNAGAFFESYFKGFGPPIGSNLGGKLELKW